ncbi:hypothetical protein PR048_027486 [Dryococelus australis]|uniref:Uncharacterized protein n=1 Tax=Dryococelus australis TaxID=614101 RepID=A0ABQ9GFL2_9NEOP|nr:hypothetical protein PR048_027486 [Dryococelus australis]
MKGREKRRDPRENPPTNGIVQHDCHLRISACPVRCGHVSCEEQSDGWVMVVVAGRYHQSEILATIVNEYTDWERPVQHPFNIRDETMEALGDALVVAPVVRAADMHASGRKRPHLYVFEYQTRSGDYPQCLRLLLSLPAIDCQSPTLTCPVSDVDVPIPYIGSPFPDPIPKVDSDFDSPVSDVDATVPDIDGPIPFVDAPIADVDSPVSDVDSPVTDIDTPIMTPAKLLVTPAMLRARVLQTVADVPPLHAAFESRRSRGLPATLLCSQSSYHCCEEGNVFRAVLPTSKLATTFVKAALHLGETGSIPSAVAPGFSHVGIVPDDAAGQRIFSGISHFPRRCIPVLLHYHLSSPSSALNKSMLRATHIPPSPYILLLRYLSTSPSEGCGGVVVRLFAFHQSEPGSNASGGRLPGFSRAGIVTGNAAGRRGFPGVLPFPLAACIPALLRVHLDTPSSALINFRGRERALL